MTLDLFEITEHVTGGVEPFLNKFVCAALMPLMILLGGMYRFLFNEGKGSRTEGSFAALCFLLSACIFAVVLSSITQPLLSGKCMISSINNTSTVSDCGPLSKNTQADKSAVFVLSFVWLGYPLVSISTRLWHFCNAKAQDDVFNGLSLFKDILYAILDVVSKGGLAIYAAYRYTRLV